LNWLSSRTTFSAIACVSLPILPFQDLTWTDLDLSRTVARSLPLAVPFPDERFYQQTLRLSPAVEDESMIRAMADFRPALVDAPGVKFAKLDCPAIVEIDRVNASARFRSRVQINGLRLQRHRYTLVESLGKVAFGARPTFRFTGQRSRTQRDSARIQSRRCHLSQRA